MKEESIIVDLDGTLCDASHRVHYMDQPQKDYQKFFSEIQNDTLHLWCYNLIIAMKNIGVTIILLTGRKEQYRDATEKWLNKHKVPYFQLLMRKDNDYRTDPEFKKEVYYKQIIPRYNVQFVLEDRNSVVKMWREINVTCLHCADGNF